MIRAQRARRALTQFAKNRMWRASSSITGSSAAAAATVCDVTCSVETAACQKGSPVSRLRSASDNAGQSIFSGTYSM